MLLKMPFLTAYNPIINWTAGKFQGQLAAYTSNSSPQGPTKKKQTSEFPCPIDDIHVRKTTIATQLAIKAADQQECPWQEIVPKEYH